MCQYLFLLVLCQNVMYYCTALSAVFDWICAFQVFTIISGSITCNSSGSTWSQSSKLAEPLWTDPRLKSRISVRELISTLKKKEQVGNKLPNILPKSSHARKKPPPPPPSSPPPFVPPSPFLPITMVTHCSLICNSTNVNESKQPCLCQNCSRSDGTPQRELDESLCRIVPPVPGPGDPVGQGTELN